MGMVLNVNESHDDAINYYDLESGTVCTTDNIVVDETRLGFTDDKVNWFPADINVNFNQQYSEKVLLPGSEAANKARSSVHNTSAKRSPASSRTQADSFELGLEDEVDPEDESLERLGEHNSMGEQAQSSTKTSENGRVNEAPVRSSRRNRQPVNRFTQCALLSKAFAYNTTEDPDNQSQFKTDEQVQQELHDSGWYILKSKVDKLTLKSIDSEVRAHLARGNLLDEDSPVVQILVDRARRILTFKKHRNNPLKKFKKMIKRKGPEYVRIDDKEVPLPKNYEEAMSDKYRELFEPAILEEITSIYSNSTLGEPQQLPDHKAKALGLKWIFSVKRRADGSVERYAARLVA